jgi:hypothetical protein
MAGVDRLEQSKLVGVGFDRVGELEQQAAAVGRRNFRPGGKGPLGRLHRAIDILRAAFGDGRDQGVVVRRQDVEGPPIGGVDKGAVDVELVSDALDSLLMVIRTARVPRIRRM